MITVLRLGHRFERDKRISTHICLTARALGADEVVFDVQDERVEDSVKRITDDWGGNFKVNFIDNYKKFIKNFDGVRVHLTMYGLNINVVLKEISDKSEEKNLLIIVGGQKVDSEVYFLTDYNVGIGNQPHSEVAALAVFLDRFFDGKETQKKFNGNLEVIPKTQGKEVIKKRKI
ncbi:tRNA (cytidine(56)-2'-O)-methyltransferase [groundwater metagenome]|uniref:tRNA (cytidine(56)-2'-O)-methyltransferase n=1 Tax=groundwater metagenome TaxID=717931 RepID=A0A098EC78_9ZZZZ